MLRSTSALIPSPQEYALSQWLMRIWMGRRKWSGRQLTCQNVKVNLQHANETDIWEQRIMLAIQSTPCDTHPCIAGHFLHIAVLASIGRNQVLLALYHTSQPMYNRSCSVRNALQLSTSYRCILADSNSLGKRSLCIRPQGTSLRSSPAAKKSPVGSPWPSLHYNICF